LKNKPAQFRASVPQHTPQTLIKANDESNREWVWREMDKPFVAKLPKSSMGQGVWLIESTFDWRRYCAMADVLYVQEYLPIERDLRVVVVGNHPYLLEFNRLFGTRGVAGGQETIRNLMWNYLQEELVPPKPSHPGLRRKLRRAA
jgi:glutathione synthase/RimK-type ligase-like ATP-grasp enzyme